MAKIARLPPVDCLPKSMYLEAVRSASSRAQVSMTFVWLCLIPNGLVFCIVLHMRAMRAYAPDSSPMSATEVFAWLGLALICSLVLFIARIRPRLQDSFRRTLSDLGVRTCAGCGYLLHIDTPRPLRQPGDSIPSAALSQVGTFCPECGAAADTPKEPLQTP
jgi:hypothetical protein